MPRKDRESYNAYMQDYRERKAEEVLQREVSDLALIGTYDEQTRINLEIIHKKNFPNDPYPGERLLVSREVRPLPEKLKAVPNMVLDCVPDGNLDRITRNLSRLYYGEFQDMRKRMERFAEAFVWGNQQQFTALQKRLKEAEEFLVEKAVSRYLSSKVTSGLVPGVDKAESYSQRLRQFSYCAKELKDEGFGWYETAQVCGERFLEREDFESDKERIERGGFSERDGRAYFLPFNRWWTLGSNFQNQKDQFTEAYADLAWLVEWANDERPESERKEQIERKWMENNYENTRAAKLIMWRSQTGLAEGLTDLEIFEGIKSIEHEPLTEAQVLDWIRHARWQFLKDKEKQVFGK